MTHSYQRPIVAVLRESCRRHPDLLQVLTGPRQVGKTTAALQVMEDWEGPTRYAAADQYLPPGPEWIGNAWDLARSDTRGADRPALLVLDEVQKVRGWSEAVKAEWDTDRRRTSAPCVLLLGSSALLLSKGATESLAGRFLLHRCLHWTFGECRDAFGWNLDQWLWWGGYPGTARFDEEEARKAYVRDALIEAVIARDVLSLESVAKPALLRQLFALSCRYPAHILSFNKMLGQLQEAGNTTTLAHYLELLGRAFLVSGLAPHAAGVTRMRAGSPKLVVWNNALVSALDGRTCKEARADAIFWGRVVENAVGAHLLNHLQGRAVDIGWWRTRDREVDFVLSSGNRLLPIEVKSGRSGVRSGLEAFAKVHPAARPLLVGGGGMPLEAFFLSNPADLLA